MRPATIAGIALLLLFGGFSIKVKRDLLRQRERTSRLSYGDVAPHFTLSRIDGGEVDLSAVVRDRKVVVVNFWATWCAPCRIELPQMEKLYQRHRDAGVEFLAITSEEEAVVKAFLLEHAYSIPVLLDPAQEIAGKYGVEALPTTFVLRRGGGIWGITSGIDMGLEHKIKAILAAQEEHE